MSRTRTRFIPVLAAIGLAAAACGSGHKDTAATTTAPAVATTSAATTAETTEATEATTAGTDAGTETTESADTTASTEEETTTTEPAGETFGDLPSPCGAGDASGATDKGVTDTDITIGYGDDEGYAAAPGLDKEMSDAMKAMIDWCNEQGGINGRQVLGNFYDAKVTEVDKAFTQACADKVFMMVGEGYVFDSGQEQIRIGCQLAAIPGFAVSGAFNQGPGVRLSVPAPGDEVTVSGAYQAAMLFPESVKKAAFVYAQYPATQEPRDKYAAGFPSAGWNFLDCDQIYGIGGEADWTPFASALQACGVDAVVWVGSPNPNFQNLLVAAQQVGFNPTLWYTENNQYDSDFAKWNGENNGAGDHVYVRTGYVPFEEATPGSAVQQYMDIVGGAGGKLAILGEASTSAFLLWATAVQACGSEVTAKCVFEQVDQIKDWSAGGLHAPGDPGANETSPCGILLNLAGATFERAVPIDGFDCQDKYVVKGLTTDAVTAALLDANRVSTLNGTFTP
jgi:ABC-type branched-subunit amino acid transport system substrate-binding protein